MRICLLFPLLVIPYASQVARASLVDDLLNDLSQTDDCDSCLQLLISYKDLADLGDSVFTESQIALCKTLKVEDDDVCEGLLSQVSPILAHDLRSISPSGQTATRLCFAIFGSCQQPPVNEFKFPLPPPPKHPKKWTRKGRKPFQMVHFSDVHIDRDYTPGAETNCTKSICCRNYADQAGKPIQVPAGPMGDHHCDTPTVLAESMLRAASIQQNSFAIFTGDVIEGDVWLVNQTSVTRELQQFNREMQNLIHGPVFPAIGNHDVAPVNEFPRNTTAGASAQWVFDTQSAGWSEWLDPVATRSVQHNSGSYSVAVPGKKLRIVSVNTILWLKDNHYLFDSDTPQSDPNGILSFVAEQLQIAEDLGERAYIIGHMQPGHSNSLYDQSNYFDQIVQRYKNTIVGQFYGHSHKDEFAIAYSDYNDRKAENADSFVSIGPALTPTSGNPAFKVYDIDPDTYEIMDVRVFMTNMSDPFFQSHPRWEQYYSAREVYGRAIHWPAHTPLTPAFWHKLTEEFEEDDELFKKFLEFKHRGIMIEVCPPGDCKDVALCQLRAARSESNCFVPTPSISFRRRDLGDEEEEIEDSCEGVNMHMILSRIHQKIRTGVDLEELKTKLKSVIPPQVA